jgi:hypothetical protein
MTRIETATMQVLCSRPRTAIGLVVKELGKQGVSFEAPKPKFCLSTAQEQIAERRERMQKGVIHPRSYSSLLEAAKALLCG